MKKMIVTFLLTATAGFASAQEMKVVDSTTSFKPVRTIERGTLIKTSSLNFYEIGESVTQKSGWPAQPQVVVYQQGKKYKMRIQGMDKVLAVNKIQEVIESSIVGAFTGYDGNTSFKLRNQQMWKQAETTSNVFASLQEPVVTIYLTSEGYKMKIEGVNEDPILVKKIN